jgi:PAS domain S-box-containing protein
MTTADEFASWPNVAAIAIAEERYRALIRATSSLVWITPPDGQIFDQPEWRAYTGTSVEQIKGWGWLESLHPDDRERARISWQRAVDTRSFYETEYRIRRADGVYVWHQARGIPILEADGSVREWFGICADIQPRKDADAKRVEAEMALRRLNDVLEHRVEAEARERARIWNVSQDMLVVTDLEGTFLSLNPAWTTTLGWSEDDLVGNTYEWLVHSDDRNSTHAEVARVAAGNTTQQFENRLRHKDGSFRWLSWTAVPDRDRIYAVVRDVTGIKAAEEDLRSSRQELARVGRLMTTAAVTASIAHEVRQPIAAARNNACAALNFLDGQPPDLGEVREALRCIVGDADRAGVIIERFRDHIKKAPPRQERFDLNEAIDEVIVLARGAITKNGVSVQTRMTEGPFPVEGDRVQLQQVVVNLILNAVEAMGSVQEGPRELSISTAQSQAGGALVAVIDSGPGVDPEHVERVFEAFYTTKSSGLGVGLAICRSVIEAHGGRLWAEANEPRGAVFQFTLPDTEGKLMTSFSGGSPDARAARRRRQAPAGVVLWHMRRGHDPSVPLFGRAVGRRQPCPGARDLGMLSARSQRRHHWSSCCCRSSTASFHRSSSRSLPRGARRRIRRPRGSPQAQARWEHRGSFKLRAGKIADGETVLSICSGGGGYGPPDERDPQRVTNDVVEGRISRDRAREIYKVVFGDNGQCDETATSALRSRT